MTYRSEALKLTIALLEKEGASPETYRHLNILAQACMWSEESYKIVQDAADLVRKNHITAPGHWR